MCERVTPPKELWCTDTIYFHIQSGSEYKWGSVSLSLGLDSREKQFVTDGQFPTLIYDRGCNLAT